MKYPNIKKTIIFSIKTTIFSFPPEQKSHANQTTPSLDEESVTFERQANSENLDAPSDSSKDSSLISFHSSSNGYPAGKSTKMLKRKLPSNQTSSGTLKFVIKRRASGDYMLQRYVEDSDSGFHTDISEKYQDIF